MPAGAFSIHHKLTYYGRYPNRSGKPRRSFAVYLRSQKSTAMPGKEVNPTDKASYDYVSYLGI